MPETAPAKNESETLFETYLRAHGIKEWDFEAATEGKTRRPDYRITFKGLSFAKIQNAFEMDSMRGKACNIVTGTRFRGIAEIWRTTGPDQASSGAPQPVFSNAVQSCCACSSAEGVTCCGGAIAESPSVACWEILAGGTGSGAFFDWMMRSNSTRAALIR